MSIALAQLSIFIVSQVGTPGPANMALMATGARYGFKAALPFICGVTLGKQLLVWPLGLGLLQIAQSAPLVFAILKYASAAYVIWLAWKVANLRLSSKPGDQTAPGFAHGLWVHPLNPKAWGMITASFTNFVPQDMPAINATATVAAVLFLCQSVLHPVWTYGGSTLSRFVAGTKLEPYLMLSLAAATVGSVLLVIW